MKELLAKYAYRKSIGLAIGEQQAALSVVAFTPVGWAEVSSQVEPVLPDKLDAAVIRLLAPWVGKRGKTNWPVTVGIPALRVFYTTRPVSLTGASSPLGMLHEVLQTSHAGSDDMVADMIRSSPGKRSLATLATCRKRYLSALVATLVQHGTRVSRAEPSPCAFARLAATRARAPRGSELVARVILGDSQGLAILVAGQNPLLWRSFELPVGGEAQAILAALAALRMLARSSGIGLAIDTALIHGRPDLGPLIEPEEFKARTEAQLVRCDSPGMDIGSIALGCALGAMQTGSMFDLARDMKPRAAIKEIFPWGESAIQFATLFCVSLFLWRTDGALTDKLTVTQAHANKIRWLGSTSEAQLEKDKKALEQQVDAAEAFLATRVDWNAHTQEVADWVPKNVNVLSLHGMSDLAPIGPTLSAAKPKRSLVLHLSTPIPEHGAIDRCVASLRSQALLKQDFPTMKLADMKWNSPLAGNEPVATFSVVCEPNVVPAASGTKGTQKNKKAK